MTVALVCGRLGRVVPHSLWIFVWSTNLAPLMNHATVILLMKLRADYPHQGQQQLKALGSRIYMN